MLGNYDVEKTASVFLELSSEQRLKIILRLEQGKTKMSVLAKELDATVPEIHRNFTRLSKTGLIEKDVDGNYCLTLFGKTVFAQINSLMFIPNNKNYFKNHTFSSLPDKFIQRIGSLDESELVTGYIKVMEKWNDIYKNSEEYLYNVLVEVPYDDNLIKTLSNKLKNNVKIKSIFSEFANVSKERKSIISQSLFKKFIMDESIKRKMNKKISIVIILNQREAGICFPTLDGDIDMSKMLCGTSALFHEWCFDYFDYLWRNSNSFLESKLGTNN
ncbi:helix-turn-helix transcriptional regulator [Nitrosopumilus adriaticus]|uniref:helix-turn-helix transcriptional regulator n=1 Tax=Nitrosopumilus adriaticus TaxID=1580092 RepID=UPI00352D6977